MTLKKTKDLAAEFGFCTKTMHTMLRDMANAKTFGVIPPSKKGSGYRATTEAVQSYLMGRHGNE